MNFNTDYIGTAGTFPSTSYRDYGSVGNFAQALPGRPGCRPFFMPYKFLLGNTGAAVQHGKVFLHRSQTATWTLPL